MGRHKGEPTAVARLPREKLRKLRYISKRLKLPFKDVFVRISGARIDDIERRLRADEHVELGEAGA